VLPFLFLDTSSDSDKLLEQLLSKEVADVSAQQPQSVDEMRKVLEDKDKVIEEKDKQLEDQRKENQTLQKEIEALARRIKELEAQASKP